MNPPKKKNCCATPQTKNKSSRIPRGSVWGDYLCEMWTACELGLEPTSLCMKRIVHADLSKKNIS